MSDKTVKELAAIVKIPLDRFLEQLKEAGVSASSPDDLIDEDERVKLLAHLRKMHGKEEDKTEKSSPKKITLKRRKVSELQQSTGPGAAAKTVNVEVRKKRTYIKRSESVVSEEQKEIERVNKALEEQKKQIAAEEEERKKHEQSIQATLEENNKKQQTEIIDTEIANEKDSTLAEKEIQESKSEDDSSNEQKDKVFVEGDSVDKIELAKEEEKIEPEPEPELVTLSEEEIKEKKLSDEKKLRLEASIERNAAKVRKQAEAKKQQTLHKKKQAGAAKTKPGGVAHTTRAATPGTQKRGIAPGRGQAMPTGVGRRAKGKKGKQKRIQLAAELDANKHQFEKPIETIVKDVAIPETIIVS